mmetsp:Transcript_66847/g.188211  ORF Transcript_66847/g.188211 Transcript_66847/m.188211 type:complete len:200 (-) Transcript_66847:301-900(-)
MRWWRSNAGADRAGSRVNCTGPCGDCFQKRGTEPRSCTKLSQPWGHPAGHGPAGIPGTFVLASRNRPSCSVSMRFPTSPLSSSPRALYRVPARPLPRREISSSMTCSSHPGAFGQGTEHRATWAWPCISGTNQRWVTPSWRVSCSASRRFHTKRCSDAAMRSGEPSGSRGTKSELLRLASRARLFFHCSVCVMSKSCEK